jgi:hypothetical protein
VAKALDAATAHYKALGTPHIDVPEWQVPVEGSDPPKTAPLRIHYTPLTIIERERLLAGEMSDTAVLIARALDDKGQKLFAIEDEPVLRRAVSFHVINRIAIAISSLPPLTVEDARKN